MKRVIKILSNKFISFFVIPLVLLVFWFACSLIFNNQISFSVLVHSQNNSDLKNIPDGKLLKGNAIQGEFTATHNNLGIIMIKFDKYVKPNFSNEDILLFTLKEKDKNNLYYSSEYRSGSFEYEKYFPFGFESINNSKGQVYEFELKSLRGVESNALQIKKNSAFLTGYQFSKSEIFSGLPGLTSFLINKAFYSFTNSEFILSSMIYLLPFIAYILFLVLIKKQIVSGNILAISALVLTLADIFLIQDVYYGVSFTIIFIWIATVMFYKLESSITFALAFTVIMVWVVLVYFRIYDFSEKINILTYALLLMGIAQVIIEEKFNLKEMKNINYLIDLIKK